MPWRLILFAIFLVLLVAFVGTNLTNTCAVSLIFVTYQNVPVYISILIAFALGIIVMIPFTFGRKSGGTQQKQKPAAKAAKADKADNAVEPVARPLNDD